MPAKWWEVIELDRNYGKVSPDDSGARADRRAADVLEQVHHPQVQTAGDEAHGNAQAHEEAATAGAVSPADRRPELVTIKKKADRREKIREAKASIAARHETEIEKELLERLKAGTYGDIYNVNMKQFKKVAEGLEQVEEEDEFDEDQELEKMVGRPHRSSTSKSSTKRTT